MDGQGPAEPTFEITSGNSRDPSTTPDTTTPTWLSDAIPDAELRVPVAWKTVDRVLDVLLWHPQKRKGPKDMQKRVKARGKGKGKAKRRVVDSDEDSEDSSDEDIERERIATFRDGEQPNDDLTETLDEWEARTGNRFGMNEIDRVVWAFLKWDDLGYEQSKFFLFPLLIGPYETMVPCSDMGFASSPP
jgi:chromodomain-helicase-DNA-binding protein 4